MKFQQRNIPPEPGTPESEKETGTTYTYDFDTIFPSQKETSRTSLSTSPHLSELSSTNLTRNPLAPRNLVHTPPANIDECKEKLQSIREKLHSNEEESLTGLFIHSNTPQNQFLKGVHGPAFLGDSTARFFAMQLKFEFNSRVFLLISILCCYASIQLYRFLLVWVYQDIPNPTSASASSWSSFEQDSLPGLIFVSSNQVVMFLLISTITYFPFLHQLPIRCRVSCFVTIGCLLMIAGIVSFIFATQGLLRNYHFYITDVALLCGFAIGNAYYPLHKVRSPTWFRDFFLYATAISLTTAFVFISPMAFHYFCLKDNPDSSRIIFLMVFPIACDVFLICIRTSARMIQIEESQNLVLHSLALPIYSTIYTMMGLACISCSDLSTVTLATTISMTQVTISKYVLFYRDLLPMKMVFADAKQMYSKMQLRFSAEFTLLEHLCQFCGTLIACILSLVFNVSNEHVTQLIWKCLICLLLHILISQLPVLCVCGCSNMTLDSFNSTSEGDRADIEVAPVESFLSRACKTTLIAIKRRHCDFVNVWCSKHEDFHKHFLLTLIATTMAFVQILFDPLQYLCLENGNHFENCL